MLALAGILLLLAILFYPAVYGQLKKWKLTPGYEPYTELYFNNYRLLPSHIYTHEKGTFNFTIHNVEGVDVTYSWTSYFLEENGKKHVFKNGTVFLKNGESISVSSPYIFQDASETGTVIVSLKNINQQISFIIPNNNN